MPTACLALSDDYILRIEELSIKLFYVFNCKSGTVYLLDEISHMALSLCDGHRNYEEIVSIIGKACQVEPKDLDLALMPLFKKWLAMTLISEVK